MRTTARTRTSLASQAGYSLVELLVSMGIMTVVMAVTMNGISDVVKANDVILQMVGMNNSLRSGMDLIVRDLLQVGSGLPTGHTVTIPNGAGALSVRIPGPPGTSFTTAAGDTTLPAVIPGAGLGPVVNGTATDVLSVLMADNAFLSVGITAATSTSVTVAAGVNIDTGPDRVTTGQLMMISKGSLNTLVQVTAVNVGTRVLTFASGDSLRLNQPTAAQGNLAALNAAVPANDPTAVNVTRLRMITYYLDTTIDANHPRLVRRINNGHPTTFNNTLGTAVAIDTENLQFTYDINNADRHDRGRGVCPRRLRPHADSQGERGADGPVAGFAEPRGASAAQHLAVADQLARHGLRGPVSRIA
jgi:prepilin-type N-terminal cleavage/methylation domain-containing protein